MVRQEYLESLVDPELGNDDLIAGRAVVRFIDDFTGRLRDNLSAVNEDNKRKAIAKKGAPDESEIHESEYMQMSPDFEDLTPN